MSVSIFIFIRPIINCLVLIVSNQEDFNFVLPTHLQTLGSEKEVLGSSTLVCLNRTLKKS